MKRLIVLVSTLVLIPVLALGGIYAASELRLREFNEPPAFDVEIPTDSGTVARGEHIARIRGCFGCHGQQLQGRVYTEQWPWVERAVAPNLALYARRHSPTVMNAAIRHGVGHDGRALWSMPSYNWKNLADEDLIALIAFLRMAPVQHITLPSPKLGYSARWNIATRKSQHMAEWSEMVPALSFQSHRDPAIRQGEYLAMTMCNECHGLDLRGMSGPDGIAPDLAVLAAYSEADFRLLMRTGTAIGGRDDLNLMSMIARDRFHALSEQELMSLLAFLRILPDQPRNPDAPWRQLN